MAHGPRTTLFLLALAAGAHPLAAQDQGAERGGSVAGTVLAAASGVPLAGAVVVLEAASDAAVVAPAASGGAFLGRTLTAVTDESGNYRFSGLPPGAYRLLVRHLGFHPAVVHVDLAQASPFRVSVALTVNPIRLEPMDARAISAQPYARMRGAADEARYGRLDAEQYRDATFLEGDVAVLTHTDVVEAVTLGETDLFRALQRLPGVSARDDFTAGLWTRGAAWGQTRVYFDGLPLFNPVHAIGVFSGVNPDAVGAASFHPGVRPSSIGEGAAGVLNVTSRRAGGPGMRGLGELSVISARGAADWASPSGRVGLMLAARRSYVDLVTRLAETLGADSGTYIPYAFFDLSGRLDADLGGGVGLEASGMLAEDDVHGDIRDLLSATRGTWGNRAGRVTLTTPLAGLRIRHTVGVSDFEGRLNADQLASSPGSVRDAPTHGPTRNGVTVLTLSQSLAPTDAPGRPTWSGGLQFTLQRQDYLGQFPRPYPVVVLPDQLSLNERLGVFALWAERRLGLGRHAALDAGLRLETHRAVRNAPAAALAPRLTVRATPPGSRITVSAAAARSFQYTQALAPAGPSVGPDLYVTDVWLLANDTIPAVRADIATLGVETFLGAWNVAVNAYVRHATGVAVPEPGPGPLNNQRPIFVAAENRARGVEVSARRLIGRWTASAAFTMGRSDLRAASGYPGNGVWRYPSTADRRRVLDLTLLARVGDGWRLGGALTVASGAPYSRFLLGLAPCDSIRTCTAADTAALSIELPNGVRSHGYASLDLLADWSTALGRVRIGAFLQVRNVLDLVNPVTYTGTLEQCTTPDPPLLVRSGPGLCDRFDRGVPRLPLAGLRVAF